MPAASKPSKARARRERRVRRHVLIGAETGIESLDPRQISLDDFGCGGVTLPQANSELGDSSVLQRIGGK